MLFSSEEFLFRFLPVTLLGFYILYFFKQAMLMRLWLVGCSIYFYARWNFDHAFLLGALGCFNYILVVLIQRGTARNYLAALGIVVNLSTLAYFKYAGFLVGNFEMIAGVAVAFAPPVLPLAISFFTFQKIAVLIDAKRGYIDRVSPSSFALFVLFFPQLIAGPIVHFKEIAPQIQPARWFSAIPSTWMAGLVCLSLGLGKKVVVADSLSSYIVTPYFSFVNGGGTLDVVRGWLAALAYTAQIYFDFSGYSDMAIGLGLLFGISLPVNFFSPYKATSIIDFWRRWHITLSRFLTDYLYIPLGGNRKGVPRRFLNLMIVMLLGGLWHGAAWTFVVWGALHGAYLIANHGWRYLVPPSDNRLRAFAGWALTFIAVVVGWVFFRAESFTAAYSIIGAMAGVNGLFDMEAMVAQAAAMAVGGGSVLAMDILIGSSMVISALAIAFIAPNTMQLVRFSGPPTEPASLSARPWLLAWAGLCAGFATWQILAGQPSEFIYFRF